MTMSDRKQAVRSIGIPIDLGQTMELFLYFF